MAFGGAYGGYYAFAYAGQHCVLAGTTHELADIGAHCHAGFRYKLDAVFRHSGNRRCVYHFGIHTHLHGLEHVAAGEVDGGRHFEAEVDVGFCRRHKCVDNTLHITAGEVVGFEVVAGYIMQAGLVGLDERADNNPRRNLSDTHEHQLQQRHLDAAHPGGYP